VRACSKTSFSTHPPDTEPHISPLSETALSILAEILAVSAGRPGGTLRAAAGRIHVER
jgi:hypothetical protein